MSNPYRVDQNIPIPPIGDDPRRERMANKYPLATMGIGDSFFIPLGDEGNDVIKQRLKRAVMGRRVTEPAFDVAVRLRTENGLNGIRVWRTA